MSGSRQPAATLTMTRGPGAGTRFDIGVAPITIGREAQCEAQVKGTWVSRRHARVVWSGTEYIVEDLGGTNGTFVNGERVDGPRALKSGDFLQLGEQVELAFQARVPTLVHKEPEGGTQACPQCETLAPAGETYCHGCGYEFSTGNEAVGPFSFQLPAVESAYKPSGIGTAKGTLLMLVFGLGAAIVLGPLIYATHVIAAQIAALFLRMNMCLSGLAGTVIFFLGYALAAPMTGALVGTAIGRGAIVGKSRNSAAARRMGLALGLVCFGTFVVTYFAVLGMDEGLDSLIDYLKLGWNLLAVPFVAYIMADEAIKDTPFCEECQEFMRKAELKNRPIRHEKALLAVLNAGEVGKVGNFAPDEESKNYCKITVWSCNCDRGWGFVHMHTTQRRISKNTSGKVTENTQTRMVFSARVAGSELGALLS